VAVTRPARQAQGLMGLIESLGGTALLFPVLEILEPEDLTPVDAVLDRLEQFDLAVFISANAADYGVRRAHQRHGGWPPALAVAAVGQATLQALERQGVSVAIRPTAPYNSESLLASPALEQVAGRRVLILRGVGGRELLRDALLARGAAVEYAEVYRRVRPATDGAELMRRRAAGGLDLIAVSSNESLANLLEMVGPRWQDALLDVPLVVIGERSAAQAATLGFRRPAVVAEAASDAAMLAAMVRWRREQSS